MDVPASRESRQHFSYILKKYDIPEQHYKILECIFRQALMKCCGYKYNDDNVDVALARPMNPKERMDLILKYISDWENKTGMQYGFELVHLNETDKLIEQLDAYQVAQTKLMELLETADSKAVIEKATVMEWLNELQDKVKQTQQVNNRKVGRFLVFDPTTGKALVRDTNHEYFKFYLAVSNAVFAEYLKQLSDYTNNRAKFRRLV